jgi:hypothetical protein
MPSKRRNDNAAEKSHHQRATVFHERLERFHDPVAHEIKRRGHDELVIREAGFRRHDVDGHVRLEERAIVAADQFRIIDARRERIRFEGPEIFPIGDERDFRARGRAANGCELL